MRRRPSHRAARQQVLADRKTAGRMTGTVKVNGFDKKPTAFARIMGYCEQDDVHSSGATVRESVWLSGRLRLGDAVSSEKARPASAFSLSVRRNVVALLMHAARTGVLDARREGSRASRRTAFASSALVDAQGLYVSVLRNGLLYVRCGKWQRSGGAGCASMH